MRVLPYLPLLVIACDNDAPPASAKPQETHAKLAGVYPERFVCESIATLEVIGQVLGGTARATDTAISTQPGVPRPCNYEIQTASGPEYWFYDIDCRDNYKQTADALFAQYAQISADMVQQYNKLADAGIKPNDAGIVFRAPESAAEVAVGAKGLDHRGQGLIFIDDDAPCYVRVVGPDPIRRLDFAKLLAKNLTFANAPMTPRAK